MKMTTVLTDHSHRPGILQCMSLLTQTLCYELGNTLWYVPLKCQSSHFLTNSQSRHCFPTLEIQLEKFNQQGEKRGNRPQSGLPHGSTLSHIYSLTVCSLPLTQICTSPYHSPQLSHSRLKALCPLGIT